MPPSSTTSSPVVFPEARHFVSKEHVRYEFSSSAPPVVKVDPGDLVHIQTNDCFHGRVQPNSLSSWNKEQQQQQRNDSNHDGDSDIMGSSDSGGGSFINGSILDDIPRSKRNPVTGPIFVNGARPGDILAVTLVDIRPQGIGIACCGSAAGQLCGWMKKESTTIKFFDLSQCGTIVTMRDFNDSDNKEGAIMNGADNNNTDNDTHGSRHPQSRQEPHRRRRLGPISFPASPMLGVIGVAPSAEENDPIGTIPAGKHGGNLDNNCNGIGSTVYLPVNHPGALLSIGDMHASQGDGEISGTGVEIGGDVLLRCQVIRQENLYGRSFGDNDNVDHNDDDQWKLEYPVTETATHWITHGVVEGNIPETTSIACKEAAKILVGQWGFSVEESFIFLSVKGDLGYCQACHPDVGTQISKMSVPKLDSLCPKPFRVLSESESPTTS